MNDFLFIIYSCKKNLYISNKIYDKIHNKINNTKIYILYGENEYFNNNLYYNSVYNVVDDKYIVLNTDDTYDNLNKKTLLLLKTVYNLYPSIKGIFKCDDDVIININYINKLINKLLMNEINDCNYIGNMVNINKSYIIEKNLIEKNLIENINQNISYCGGPLYYLSNKSIKLFSNTKCELINAEDIMIGYHLNMYNIYPNKDIELYSNYNKYCNIVSYHNQYHINDLHIILNGNLGNILFKLACVIKFSNIYNKDFIFNENTISLENKIEVINIIKLLFPNIKTSNYLLKKDQYYLYEQSYSDIYKYNEKNIDDTITTYNNVVLNSSFINYSYIPDITTNTLFNNINIYPLDTNLLKHDFNNNYFIHILFNTIKNNIVYDFNLLPYYKFCINKIISINPNAIFYICSNKNVNYIKTYFKNISFNNKVNIQTILDNNYNINNEVNTFYIMSKCNGGICSRSALSIMGTHFQKFKNKETIYMPYPFVELINGFNSQNVNISMYPDWCNVYDINKNILIQ